MPFILSLSPALYPTSLLSFPATHTLSLGSMKLLSRLSFCSWEWFFPQAQLLFAFMTNYMLQEHLPPNSCHSIVTFIVPALGGFLALKYVGKMETPFLTHPKTMRFAIGSFLVYCLAYGGQLRFCGGGHSPDYVHALSRCMELAGCLLLASLASLFFPDSVQWMLFGSYVVLWMAGLLYTLLQLFWKWIHRPQTSGDEETN